MDNVTHSLIGIVAGDVIAVRRKPATRVPLWIASAVANNLPDLDVVYTWFHRGDRLAYLLHHRGYTHTLLLGPLQGLLWLGVLRLLWRRRPDVPWRDVALLCVLGPFLHVFADAWNSYGVHPLWPLDNTWYYGDLVFIVEPLLWVILLPVVAWRARSIVGRGLAAVLGAAMLALVWAHPYATFPASLGVTLALAGWLAAQRVVRGDRARLVAAFGALAVAFGAFALGRFALRQRFAAEGVEVAALAQPGNPFCWNVLTAGFHGDEYVAAAWVAAPWPGLVDARSCPSFLRAGASSSLSPPVGERAADRVPLGAFRGKRAEFDRLARDCRARAYLRFARIPFWLEEGAGQMLGDLRFGGGVRFSELSVGGGAPCPESEPPWVGKFFPSAR